jgi:hypothetical protein
MDWIEKLCLMKILTIEKLLESITTIEKQKNSFQVI